VKRLIAGPWVGEFGWELFAWQAYVRQLASYFTETTVISRPNSQYLYSDFADRFVPFASNVGDADAFFMHNLDMNKALQTIIKENKIILDENVALLLPRRIGYPPHTHYNEEFTFGKNKIKPKYIQLGKPRKRKYDYIFHARSRSLRKKDNWSLENWQTLRNLLDNKNIACIGTKKESDWIEDTADLRGLNLEELCDVLRNARCVFGSSSGPMHLASLCGCDHVVWSIPANKIRYEKNWNPLDTRILFNHDYDWHPPAELIYKEYLKWSKPNEAINE